MDHNLPIEQSHFFNQQLAVNDINFQQTLQRGILTRLESSKIVFAGALPGILHSDLI